LQFKCFLLSQAKAKSINTAQRIRLHHVTQWRRRRETALVYARSSLSSSDELGTLFRTNTLRSNVNCAIRHLRIHEARETGDIYLKKARHTMHTGQMQTRGIGKLVYQLQSSEIWSHAPVRWFLFNKISVSAVSWPSSVGMRPAKQSRAMSECVGGW